jgi:uncharacterized protein YbjT (DUF2867 family)
LQRLDGVRLTVIGSTGRTGLYVLDEGVRRGHDITAFTRRPDALPKNWPPERVAVGDALDEAAVRSAVDGADGVIAIVKASSRKGPHVTAAAAESIGTAMAGAGVKRLLMTSSYAAVAPNQPRPIRWMLRDAFADVRRMEEVLGRTDLDWTVARLCGLVNRPSVGPVRISTGLFDKPYVIARTDVAPGLLDLVERDEYARQAVNVSGARSAFRRRR